MAANDEENVDELLKALDNFTPTVWISARALF